MFGFLKDKLKGALSKFSKDVEEEAEVTEEVVEKQQEVEEQPVKKEEVIEEPVVEELKEPVAEVVEEAVLEPVEREVNKEIPPEEPKEEVVDEKIASPSVEEPVIPEEEVAPEAPQEEPPVQEKKRLSLFKKKEGVKKESKEGFFTRLTKINLSDEKFEELFWELEVVLMENNVAVEVIDKIKDDLREVLTKDKIARRGIDELIKDTLRESIASILSVKSVDLLGLIDEKNSQKEPFVIAMIGVNGSGKTTTLAKLIKLLQSKNKSIVVAAADTFRAAAIQQIEEHTTKLGVKLIKHDYNADPAAVAFDAVKHAKAKGIDVVLIDSAGRLHSNDNLMNELKKLIRINNPDMKIFVGESITGNDCVEQAKLFDQAVGIDGIILAKADVDDKGGAAISASFVTKKPVLYLGVGQGYDDLKPFDAALVLQSLGL